MGKRYIDYGVQCPYYCSEDPGKLYCQGFEDGLWLHLAWGDQKKKKKYKQRICRGSWQDCPVAKMKMDLEKTSDR